MKEWQLEQQEPTLLLENGKRVGKITAPSEREDAVKLTLSYTGDG